MSHSTDAQPHSSRLRAASPLESPPGKVRTATNPVNRASTPYQKRFTPRLLSLPDEPISLIFSFLNASDTTGPFMRPRHAFALAITNTRLLRIFGTHLTRIVPDIDTGDDFFHTLTRGHMLSVIRIAGTSLRELNLPWTSRSLLKQLPVLCPRLEKIYLEDDGDYIYVEHFLSDMIPNIFRLPLRSLSIKYASSTTLSLFSKALQEVSITRLEASSDMLVALKAFVRNLPRKLHIHFGTNKPFGDGFRACLQEICLGVEDFSLSLRDDKAEDKYDGEDVSPLTPLMTILRKRRGNVRSKCRKMTLEGNVFELLKYAHTEAHVKIIRWGLTLIGNGEGNYPTRIPLDDQYQNQDLSRLTDIVIRDDVYWDLDLWNRLLSGVRLKRVRLEGAEFDILEDIFNYLKTQADVIEMSSKALLIDYDWSWLCRASEVRIFGNYWFAGEPNDSRVRNSRVFLTLLARFIDEFPGKVVSLDPSCLFQYDDLDDYFGSDHEDCLFEALILNMRRAVDQFEARGGDASTVRSLIWPFEHTDIDISTDISRYQ